VAQACCDFIKEWLMPAENSKKALVNILKPLHLELSYNYPRIQKVISYYIKEVVLHTIPDKDVLGYLQDDFF